MRIKDLPEPVVASKADWLPNTTWLGFTPTKGDLDAFNKCTGTIQRQCDNGYVIEYMTESFQKPNEGFENHPDYLKSLELHSERAGCFIAVHKLAYTSRGLTEIIGSEEFASLQNMWAKEGKHYRWSVAFPIIQSFRIVNNPKAKDVLGADNYMRLYGHSSATLRELSEEEQQLIQDLEIEEIDCENSWIGIEDEFLLAERSEINKNTQLKIDRDLAALEGGSEERMINIKRRAAWVADKFIRMRQKNATLLCDDCGFNPYDKAKEFAVSPRSFLDVHHMNPLHEGIRYTTVSDFQLLCPTCHRIEHVRLRKTKIT